MTDNEFEQNLSDREILLIIADRTRSMTNSINDHETRLRQVESKQQTQTGMFAGAGKLWSLLLGLPAGAVGYIFMQHK